MSLQVSDRGVCPSCENEDVPPEQEGDVIFYSCPCGMDFGYRVLPESDQDPSCQLGVPEEVRAAASFNFPVPVPNEPVFLGFEIPRRPS